MFVFYVSARKIDVKKTDTLVSDSLNVYPCLFNFSPEWCGLTKTAVFKAGKETREVILDENYQCEIPWEVLLKHKQDLFVGCYGVKGEELILNTIWKNVGEIYEGTKNVDNDIPEPPSPGVYEQIISKIGNLEDLETENKENLVSAINELNNKIENGVGPDGPLPTGVSSFNGRTGAVVPEIGDYTATQVGAVSIEDYEKFQEDFDNFVERISTDLNDKLDKTGGTVTGPVLFSNQESTANSENKNSEFETGTVVSSNGIIYNGNETFFIKTDNKKIDFFSPTGNSLLTGVEGADEIPNSVPNMEQLSNKVREVKLDIPTKTSDLMNDSGFITADDIPNIPGSGVSSTVKTPVGTIVIWSGDIDDIPSGWQLCDGTNGTPDLRNRFVYGYGDKNIGDIGGTEEVILTLDQIPKHAHFLPNISTTGRTDGTSTTATGYSSTVGSTTTDTVGKSSSHENMPPYMVLAYIMKIRKDETDVGNGEGTNDHNELINRDKDNQHPVNSITGLQEILDTIPVVMTADQLRKILIEGEN